MCEFTEGYPYEKKFCMKEVSKMIEMFVPEKCLYERQRKTGAHLKQIFVRTKTLIVRILITKL